MLEVFTVKYSVSYSWLLARPRLEVMHTYREQRKQYCVI